jgi:hypothetical protein
MEHGLEMHWIKTRSDNSSRTRIDDCIVEWLISVLGVDGADIPLAAD